MSDEVKEAKKSLTELSSILAIVDKQTVGLTKSIANASNESKAWTMVSRILSGSGLWKMQNHLRAAAQAFDFYFKAQERTMKAQAQYVEDLAQLQEATKGVKDQLDLLNTLKKQGLKGISEDERKENEGLINQYELLRDNIKTARKEMGLSTDAKTLDKLTTERLGASYETLQTKLGKLGRERIKEMKKSMSIGKENKKEIKAAIAKNRDLLKIDEDYRKKIAKLHKDLDKKGNKWKKAGIESDIKDLIDAKKAATGDKEGKEKIRETITMQKQLLKGPLSKTIKVAAKHLSGLSTLKLIYKGLRHPWETMKKVGSVAKKALLGWMYFMLFILAAFVIFNVIKKIFGEAEVMSNLMDGLKGVFEGVKTVLDGFFDIYKAFFGEGTFTEKLSTLMTGFRKIFGGLGKILMSTGVAIIKIAFKLLVMAVSLQFKALKFIFTNFTKMEFWKEKVLAPIINWWDNTGKPALSAWVVKKWQDIQDLAGKAVEILDEKIWQPFKSAFITPILKVVNDILKALGGGAIGDALGDAWDATTGAIGFGKHTGGITQGGLAMVGERGPELINMPKGTRVHSNDTTKGMMGKSTTNNVSVNVSGRVGASDSELRDIAKKIGRMVSAEINRSTSSSTNVRY